MDSREITLALRSLHAEPDNGLSAPLSPSEMLALVETLSRESWALAGHVESTFPRTAWPVTVRKLRDATPRAR